MCLLVELNSKNPLQFLREIVMLLKKHVCSRALLMFLTGLGTQTLHADSFMSNFTEMPNSRPHLVIQAGAFLIDKAQSKNVSAFIGDRFNEDDSGNVNGLLGLGLYFNGAEGERVNFTYGINAFYLGKTSLRGGGVAALDPDLIWSYEHSLTNYPIYFGTKLDIGNKNNERYGFTMDFGLGPNIRVTNNAFQESLDGEVIRVNGDQTKVVFSGMVGVGFRVSEVFGMAPLECGYRFFYLGKSDFSARTRQIVTSLDSGESYANALLCSVTI